MRVIRAAVVIAAGLAMTGCAAWNEPFRPGTHYYGGRGYTPYGYYPYAYYGHNPYPYWYGHYSPYYPLPPGYELPDGDSGEPGPVGKQIGDFVEQVTHPPEDEPNPSAAVDAPAPGGATGSLGAQLREFVEPRGAPRGAPRGVPVAAPRPQPAAVSPSPAQPVVRAPSPAPRSSPPPAPRAPASVSEQIGGFITRTTSDD